MKNMFLLKLLAIPTFFIASLPSKGESIPNYYISKSSSDKTLKKTEAVFVFSFDAFENKPTKQGGIVNDTYKIKQTITFSYNGTNKTQQPDANGNITLNIKPGKYRFQFFYNKDFFEITTDSILNKPTYRTEIKVNFISSKYPVIMEKPVIYVYPEKTMPVNIKLELKGKFAFTYPEYNNGWDFVADTDGTIHMNNKKYHYLFWDGNTAIQTNNINWKEGFVINKNNLANFFEEKLSQMGLNSKEIEDYITYWCPLMNVNETNYVRFMFNEEYNEYANLTVTPKPDKLFRVFMIWSKVDDSKKLVLKHQTIQSFTRTGFSVVEWGGAKTTLFEENGLSVN